MTLILLLVVLGVIECTQTGRGVMHHPCMLDTLALCPDEPVDGILPCLACHNVKLEPLCQDFIQSLDNLPTCSIEEALPEPIIARCPLGPHQELSISTPLHINSLLYVLTILSLSMVLLSFIVFMYRRRNATAKESTVAL